MTDLSKDFIERWAEQVSSNPKQTILKDHDHPYGITMQIADDISGKVYAFLKSAKIGKEDIVLVHLPRGIKPILALIGILKAGAAFLLAEDHYPAERVKFMENDCHTKITINADNWDTITDMPPLYGHETVDKHTAAFVVYTSGSTGNPKGILHERGKLPLIVQSFETEGVKSPDQEDIFAMITPFSFIAAIHYVFSMLYRGTVIYVVKTDIVKNPPLLKKLFIEENITCTFLSSSVAKMLKGHLGNSLRLIGIGGEPANMISLDGVTLIHQYAMSESAFILLRYIIKEPLAHCPVGTPSLLLKITLEDNEIVFENPYTRGYINLPELTDKRFQNGKYHSGDIAHILPDGNYIIDGRIDDMVKINGNRVEPVEIEAVFQKLTGITYCLAKAFQKERTFICLYYQSNHDIDVITIRNQMIDCLPDYMIPSRFIRMEQLPLNANGKLARNLLPEPESYKRLVPYCAPRNEIEKKLHDSICNVLGLTDVSVYDDFYELGGDSLTTIELISQAGLYSLNASDIFKYRTIDQIATQYLDTIGSNTRPDHLKFMNKQAMEQPRRLTEEQIYLFDYQLYSPKSTMYVLPLLVKLKDTTDIDKLIEAFLGVLDAHAVFHTRLSYNDDGVLQQQYDKNFSINIVPERISDTNWPNKIDTLIQPYEKLIDTPLYRVRIFVTPTSKYLYFDIHHIICDGTSFNIILQDLAKLYTGGRIPNDYYYFYLTQKETEKKLTGYKKAKQYFLETYAKKTWTKHLPPDVETTENYNDTMLTTLDIPKDAIANPNAFFICAALMALSYCTKEANVCISWVFHGRDEAYKQHTVGLLFRFLPVALSLTTDAALDDILASVVEQINHGIEHVSYPYVISTAPIVSGDYFCVLYQGSLRSLPNEILFLIDEEITLASHTTASQSLLDIEILEQDDHFESFFDYNSSLYQKESMQHFMDIYHKTCHILSSEDISSLIYKDYLNLLI